MHEILIVNNGPPTKDSVYHNILFPGSDLSSLDDALLRAREL